MSSEGANRIFLRKNPLIEKELLKRLKRGDTTIELAEYLKTTKWPGSIEPSSVSAFIQKTYPKENMQLLLDAGYTESEIKKMNPNKRIGLKDSIKSYRKVLIPHLKKYDGTIESLVVDQVRDNKDIDYQLKKFRKETDPKVLKLLEKELGNPEFRTKIAQNQLNKLVESGGTDDIRIQRSLTSRLLKEQPTKEAWAAGEKWIVDNAPIYNDPEKMRKAFIQQFGKDHPLIEGIKTKYNPTKGFSADFTINVLGSPKEMKLTKQNLRNIFSAAIYNFNDDVRDDILAELKTFAQKAAPTRYEARDRLQTPLLKKFNLNNKIHGPISRLILQDLGKDIYRDIQNNRAPRMDTIRHLQYLQKKVDSAYKKMFGETIKSLQFAQQKLWPEAKKQFKIAQNITFEHKIPQSLIDRGYADPIEYIKVVPTQRGFNEVKFRTFDRPLTNYIAAYEKADPEDKAKWLTKMNNLKNKFNKKFGNYLGDVRINEVDGKIKLQSLGEAVTQDTDLISSLRGALKQEKGIIPEQFLKGIKENLISRAKQGGPICSIFGRKRMQQGGGAGGGCAEQMEFAFDNAPEQTLNDVGKLNDPKLKTFAQRALSLFPKLGTPGKIAAGVAAGVGTIGALTYNKELGEFVNPLNDDKASQGTLTEWIKENPVKTVAGTSIGFSAQEIPGAYKKARELGRGRTRSALGITGALKPVLTTFGTPAMTTLFEVPFGAKRLEEGDTMTEVLTDPFGPALGLTFMEPLSKGAGVIRDAPKRTMAEGLRNYFNLQNVGTARPGVTSKILRMGMSPRMIAGASRFLGLPGLALSLGLTGYDAYKNYQNQEGMIYNLFNRDE